MDCPIFHCIGPAGCPKPPASLGDLRPRDQAAESRIPLDGAGPHMDTRGLLRYTAAALGDVDPRQP